MNNNVIMFVTSIYFLCLFMSFEASFTSNTQIFLRLMTTSSSHEFACLKFNWAAVKKGRKLTFAFFLNFES